MRTIGLAACLGLVACGTDGGPRPGELLVEWRGTERGTFVAPLTVRHCVETGMVELIAVRGDTGAGAVLYLADSSTIAPGEYPVVPPTTLSELRPGASAALRWFATTQISAFEGLSGLLRIEGGPGAVSGTLEVRMQSLERPDSLRLTGRFAAVPVTVADTGCRATMRRNTL